MLLSLETVATTIIAWLIFKEQVIPHVWVGKLLIVLDASFIVLTSPEGLAFSMSGILVVLSCIFWGIDCFPPLCSI